MKFINRSVSNSNGHLFFNAVMFKKDGSFIVNCSFINCITSQLLSFAVTSSDSGDGGWIFNDVLPETFLNVGNTKNALTCVVHKIHDPEIVYDNDDYNADNILAY